MEEVALYLDDEILEDRDILWPQEPPHMIISPTRKQAWDWEMIQDAEKYGAPEGSMRQSKRPKSFSNYVALMCDLVDKEPTNYEEAIWKKERVEAMTEE